MKISDLFEVRYGINLALTHCEIVDTDDDSAINFVSRTAKNNGVVAKVRRIEGKEPQSAGLITCAAGGSVLSTFIQEKPFYSGRDLYLLIPRREMSFSEKLFYCMCIKSNAYKYSYGRQVNKTIKDIIIPDTVPSYITDYKVDFLKVKSTVIPQHGELSTLSWKWFKLSDYFSMLSGSYVPKNSYNNGETPLVSASDTNNGVLNYCDLPSNFNGNCITIGKVGLTAFYQDRPFLASADVTVLEPVFTLNKYIGLFLVGVLRADSYKWSYGRQIRLGDCRELSIKLPSLGASQTGRIWKVTLKP